MKHHRGASGGPHRCDLCYATAGPREAAGRKRRCVSKRLNCCAAAAEPGAHGKPTAAKISPAHRPHWSASPTSAAPLAGKLLTTRLNYSQKTQNWFNKCSDTERAEVMISSIRERSTIHHQIHNNNQNQSDAQYVNRFIDRSGFQADVWPRWTYTADITSVLHINIINTAEPTWSL